MTVASELHFKSVNYTGLGKGPRLIIMGAVHGNETAGTKGITRVMEQLDKGELRILNGSVTFVPVANPLAYAKGERAGDRNLNRDLFPKDDPKDFEDRIANWLCPLLASHDVLLDLHSFNAQSQPFVMVGPRNNQGPLEPFQHEEKERALARILGVKRFVDGWLRTYGDGVQRRMRDTSELQTVLRTDAGMRPTCGPAGAGSGLPRHHEHAGAPGADRCAGASADCARGDGIPEHDGSARQTARRRPLQPRVGQLRPRRGG